jgi:hypothetical protein
MSDAIINVGAAFDGSQFNAEIERSGNNMRKAFENILSKDELKDMERILNQFAKTKDVAGLRSGGAGFFGGLEQKHEEKRLNDLKAIGERYNSERERIKGSGYSDITKQLRLKEIDRKESESEKNVGGSHKEILDLEKEFNRFVRTAGRAVKSESEDVHGDNKARINRHLNLFEQSLNDIHSGQGHQVIGGHINRLSKLGGQSVGDMIAGEEGTGTLMGVSGALAGGVIAGVGAAIGFAVSKGYEQISAQKKFESVASMSTLFGADVGKVGMAGEFFNASYGRGSRFAKLGFSIDDMRDMISSTSRAQGFVNDGGVDDNGDAFRKNIELKANLQRGYGLESGDVGAFDRFVRTEGSGQKGTDVIVDILGRASILKLTGLNNDDFSGLGQAIKNVSSIMSFQQGKGDLIDSKMAVALQIAGAAINGGKSSFAGDVGGQTLTNMLSNLESPQSDGMKALFMSLAHRADPNATPFELQADISSGSAGYINRAMKMIGGVIKGKGSMNSKENFIQAILPSLNGKQIESLMGHWDQFYPAFSAPDATEAQKKALLADASGRADNAVTDLQGFWTNLEDYLKTLCQGVAELVDRFVGAPSDNHQVAVQAYQDAVRQFLKDHKNSTLSTSDLAAAANDYGETQASKVSIAKHRADGTYAQ